MWLLSAEQAARLAALQRGRDLQRIGDTLAEAFPAARAKLGERWGEFVEHGARRGAAHGLQHMLCIARLLASWIACGAEFETRQPWAAAMLADRRRGEGAKAYQLCVRVLEQLRSEPQPGQPAAAEFAQALRRIDERLAAAGALGSLLPRERIRLGAACDVDAVELRLVDAHWRQHYTAIGGPWRREACAPQAASVTLLHDALAEAAPQWPTQITLLGRPPPGAAARLRVRMKAEQRCDPLLHPLLQCLHAAGVRSWRGDMAGDTTLALHAPLPDATDALPHIGEEDAPQWSTLAVGSCGLRGRGVPVGQLSTRLAAYDAAQHLIAWRREPLAAWQLPADALPPTPLPRCRRELDGEAVDASAWMRGLAELDQQLQQALARLLTAWERESGVAHGTLAIEHAALLAGSAGITWGWAEGPQGIAAPPYMRLEGLLDLVACRLALRFGGELVLAGSRSQLELRTDGSASLSRAWQRGPDDAALFAVAAALQVTVRQAFELSVLPLAEAAPVLLGTSGPVGGAISGAVGLEQRPDGSGLRWFVRLKVEPVLAPLRLADPLLGVQQLLQPLLPACTLVDWSQA
jgi:hypothetical protein